MIQIVRSPSGTEFQQGDAIPNGSIVRLQHVRTHKWLHSHHHQSPISGNLEVCGLI
jgi:dolichyl-phosphate-mannose--protein O-mannosyl transferase